MGRSLLDTATTFTVPASGSPAGGSWWLGASSSSSCAGSG